MQASERPGPFIFQMSINSLCRPPTVRTSVTALSLLFLKTITISLLPTPSSKTATMASAQIPNVTSSMPDENTPEGIAVRRKMFSEWESEDLATLGSCPPHLRQTTVDIHLSDGFVSQTILVHPVQVSPDASMNCPLIIYLHGGGFAYNTPAVQLSPARGFAERFGAVVACPSYKLTPENPFPAPAHSAWESVSWLAEATNLNSGPLKDTGVLVDPALGFVLAGCSAGANLAAVIAGVAAATRSGSKILISGLPEIKTRITGLFVSIPRLLYEGNVPARYATANRSREENANAPVLNATLLRNSELRLKPDVRSPFCSPMNLNLHAIRAEHPQKVYIQCGELDILRDDAVIYERMLREDNVCETRIDQFKGIDHVAWLSLPFPQFHSQEMREKTLEGMGWLLGKDWDRSRPLPY
jgi:acetyl esterase/lipase